MAIDSHMHINSLVVSNVLYEVAKVNRDSNICSVINVSLNNETGREAVSISLDNPKFYASVGVHPLYIEGEDLSFLCELSNSDKVVAIGEVGLDSLGDNILLQKRYLIEQIRLANELGLPVIIHSNNMNKEVISIFKNIVRPIYGCVFHCFQPNLEDLSYLVSCGYYISFAGRITYKTARKSIEVLKEVPNELFLVETDSPYIVPEPVRDSVNSASNIKYIIDRISEIKGLSYDEISKITEDNTKRLFKKIK